MGVEGYRDRTHLVGIRPTTNVVGEIADQVAQAVIGLPGERRWQL